MDQFPLGASADAFKTVSAGNYGTCGVRSDDRVVCWGYFGEEGSASFPSLDRFLDVSVGSSFACGLRADRRLVCWGLRHDI
jgi:alpha-tubulin suppressor-like RCC1 family protein